MIDDRLILAVLRAQQGDARAFDLLVRRFQDRAVAYARTLLPDPAAAEDAAQEAFVQAWRDLTGLHDPAAFGAWLRRIVFKFCDRARRSARPTVRLEETLSLPEDQEPATVVERADEAARIRAAIDALPCPLRESTLLYYLSGHEIKEIAAFLEVPPATVKNRLRSARRKLRKELWTMAETILRDGGKPSHDAAFAANVLARVLHEFQQQEAADPHRVNRGLLEEGWTALFEMLGRTTPLEEHSLRNGFLLLWRKGDWPSLSTLLTRYLSPPRTDSETAWAYLHLADVLAMSGSAAGAVLAHDAFERWLPGKSPILSTQWPYYPAQGKAADAVYAGDDIRLLFLQQFVQYPVLSWNPDVWHHWGSVEHLTVFMKVWYTPDYLAKVEAVLSGIPETAHNRRLHFRVLQQAANAVVSPGDLDRTRRYVQQMHRLATEAEDESLQGELHAKALWQEINLAQRAGDEAAFAAGVEALTALLNRAGTQDLRPAGWIRGERHRFACLLVDSRRYEQALALWEANAASGGQCGGWGWLMYAATLWQMTHDRERTLALLREARAHDDRDMTSLFTTCREFADVRDDLQFLEAIRQKSPDVVE